MWPRGLKYRSIFYLYPHIYVEAYVASWIEIIQEQIFHSVAFQSRLARAAWIEILQQTNQYLSGSRRGLCGLGD